MVYWSIENAKVKSLSRARLFATKLLRPWDFQGKSTRVGCHFLLQGIFPTQGSFCTVKKAVNKMKRQPMEWEKIFANDETNEGLISKIYKQLIKFNNKKQPNQKRARDLNR